MGKSFLKVHIYLFFESFVTRLKLNIMLDGLNRQKSVKVVLKIFYNDFKKLYTILFNIYAL